MPKKIAQARRLVETEEPLLRFLADSSSLGAKRDVVLVELPPSFAYDSALAHAFFAMFRSHYAGRLACEPRHASWFEPHADALRANFGVARVAADPAPVAAAGLPDGSSDVRSWRLHGSPRTYHSSYDASALDALAQTLRTANALTIVDRFAGVAF